MNSKKTFSVGDILDYISGMTRFDLYYLEDINYIKPEKVQIGTRNYRLYSIKDLEKITIYWRWYDKGLSPRRAVKKAEAEINRQVGIQSDFLTAVEAYGYMRNEIIKKIKLFEDKRIDISEFDVEVVKGNLSDLEHTIYRTIHEGPIEEVKIIRGGKIRAVPNNKSVRIEKLVETKNSVVLNAVFNPPLKSNEKIRYFWEIECFGFKDLRNIDNLTQKENNKRVFALGGKKGITPITPTKRLSLTLSFDGGNMNPNYDVLIGRSERRDVDEYNRISQENSFKVIKSGETYLLEVNYPQIGSHYCICW